MVMLILGINHDQADVSKKNVSVLALPLPIIRQLKEHE